MRRGFALVMIEGLLLVACSNVKPPARPPVAPVPADVPATISRRTLELLQAGIGGRRLVLLGESHGTREAPALTGALADRYARGGESVVLALEIEETEQGRVDRYLDSPGGAVDRAALLEGWHWREPRHDGRDSGAMLELLEQMRLLRRRGAEVRVLLFDPGGEAEARDRGMADRLRACIGNSPQARLLVLTGNVHAMVRAPKNLMLDGKPYVPVTAGRLLADLAPLSIRITARTGASVACLDGECGPRPYVDSPASSAPAYESAPALDSPWDATVTLSRFTPSPPAIGEAGTTRSPASR
jgi:erythromycin esterase-like protein